MRRFLPTRHNLVRLGALLALAFAAARIITPATFPIASGELTARMTPALPGGKVTLHLGPFGELSWNMHDGPVNIEASFLIGKDVAAPPSLATLENIYGAFALRKLGWLIVAGALMGALLVHGPRRRIARAASIGALVSVGVAILLGGVSFLTFDDRGLADVRYRGPIEDAPRVFALIKEVQRDWEGVKRNVDDLVAGLERIHSQITASPGPEDGAGDAVRILVTSDLHNNPLGLVIARQLVRRFGVEGVLDAGDFTDRGTAGEAELFAEFAKLGVPYVIVAGNHEDVSALARAKRIPGVTILESRTADTAELAGLQILGDSDPNAYSVDSDPHNKRALEEIPPLCERLADRSQTVQPTIVLVHNPLLGECAAARAEEELMPLVYVTGHLHRPSYGVRGTVVAISPGTSGANGIKTARPAPYGFALLEFDRATHSIRSACLFAFDSPTALRQTECHLRPVPV
jgi:predicted phosphodiesterase